MPNPSEFVCVPGGQGTQDPNASATIYHAYGRDSGKPVYFLAARDTQDGDGPFDKALKDIGAMLWGSNEGAYKFGRIAMVDPKNNPLNLVSTHKLNLVYDRAGGIKECYIGDDRNPDPDFVIDLRVQAKPPEPLPAPKPERRAEVAPKPDMAPA